MLAENLMKPPKSKLMDQLYGPKVADAVYNRLQQLDPELNEVIQRIAYDHFWARPGLNTRDKSLITVTSLIALGKEEQIRIHINGFLGAQGTISELKGMLIQLAISVGPDSARNGLVGLKDVLIERGVASDYVAALSRELELRLNSPPLTETWKSGEHSQNDDLILRDQNLIHVAAAVAIGQEYHIKEAIQKYLKDGGSLAELKNSFIHQIVYCGFPAAMNAFAALKIVTE